MSKRTVRVTGKPPHVVTLISPDVEATMTISAKGKGSTKVKPVQSAPAPAPVPAPEPTPTPVPAPPPSDAIPDAVAKPAQGTDLTEIWNLQFGGTGPRYAPSNGKWSGAPDAYLTSVGVVMGNTGALYWYVGSDNKTLEKYDFTGAPKLHINGIGTANVRDCSFDGSSGMACPIDVNANLGFDTTALTVLVDHCAFDKATFYQGAGTLVWSYCRFKNQVQNLGDSGYLAAGVAVLSYDHCYITGGGVAPAAGAHVELTQMVRNTPGSSFHVTNTLVDVSRDGQATNLPWGSGWTGMWSVGAIPIELRDSIMLGLPAVEANPANPGTTNCILAYGIGSEPVVTNCVMEPGRYGYTKNMSQGGVPYPGRDGGGNRTLDNRPITAADLG